ncbi:MAG: glycosyltransferase family 2 protein [Pseudomonadales bacterium]
MVTRISIALAVYNGAIYLEEQLQSIVAQTVLPNELVVSDDASTDESTVIIENFARSAPFPVKLIRNKINQGYSKNFNLALRKCSGQVVFLCDQDDFWLPQKIERISQEFESRQECQLIIHDLEYCTAALKKIGQTKIMRMKGSFDLERAYVVGMATAIRGDFMRLCLPAPSEGVSYDKWLHVCADALGVKLILPEVLALYRRHSANVTGGGSLNVDYVTHKWHFNMTKLHSALKRKAPPSAEVEYRLCRWLSKNQEFLIERGYVEESSLVRATATCSGRLQCLLERRRILILPFWQRIRPIVSLYRQGGYQDFRGLGSAIKDMMR